jgi:hypothetical protein
VFSIHAPLLPDRQSVKASWMMEWKRTGPTFCLQDL